MTNNLRRYAEFGRVIRDKVKPRFRRKPLFDLVYPIQLKIADDCEHGCDHHLVYARNEVELNKWCDKRGFPRWLAEVYRVK